MRLNPEALQLPEKVNDETAARDGSVGQSGLCITHLDGVLISESEKQDTLLFIESAAVRTKYSTK